MHKPFELSVIIPLLNENESLIPLHQWIVKSLKNKATSLEILFIDDGSTDDSWKTIQALSSQYPEVKGVRFQKNYGKSQALHAGFERATKTYIATLDADLQDSPEELPQMIATLEKEGLDLISGWKKSGMTLSYLKTYPLNFLIGQRGVYQASPYMILTVELKSTVKRLLKA